MTTHNYSNACPAVVSQHVACARACCRAWINCLDPLDPAVETVLAKVSAPFNKWFGIEAARSVATHRLRELHVACTAMCDHSLAAVASGSPLLEVLDVSQCHAVSYAGIQWVAWGCCSLTDLYVSMAPMVTDYGIVEVATKCPRLSRVAFRHCPLAGDRACFALAS